MPPWLATSLTALLTLAALTLLTYSLRGTPLLRKPPRRCPRCWYDLTALPTTRTCPECGHTARSERRLHRRRRSRKLAALALTLLLTAYLPISVPRIQARGWVGAVPTTALVLRPQLLRWHRTPFPFASHELFERRLWSWQREFLFCACLRPPPDRPLGTTAWSMYEGMLIEQLVQPKHPSADSRTRRLWAALAPHFLRTSPTWPEGTPILLFFELPDILHRWQGVRITATATLQDGTNAFNLKDWRGTRADGSHADSYIDIGGRSEFFDIGAYPAGTTITIHYRLLDGDRLLMEYSAPLTTVIARSPQ